MGNLFEKVATGTAHCFTGGTVKMEHTEKILEEVQSGEMDSRIVDLIRDIVSGKIEESTLGKGDWKRVEALFTVMCNCQKNKVMREVSDEIAQLKGTTNNIKTLVEAYVRESKDRDDKIFSELRHINDKAFGNGKDKK